MSINLFNKSASISCAEHNETEIGRSVRFLGIPKTSFKNMPKFAVLNLVKIYDVDGYLSLHSFEIKR